MKLHLPKLLSVAVMASLALPAMGVTLTSDNVVTPEGKTDSYLNVGMENATDTWAGDLVIGDTAESAGAVDYVGAFNESWGWVTPNGGNTNTTITSGLKVSGNITVQGSGKVVLGGQYKGGTSYTGLESTGNITVNGGSLTATKIITNNLVVNGGTVSTSTSNCTSGTNSTGMASTAKQSYIKQSLTLNGGSLAFGYTTNAQGIGTTNHRMSAFGSSKNFVLTQNGGTMMVTGNTEIYSGSTIKQQNDAGKMVFRDAVYLRSSGTTTFEQGGTAATKLAIGQFLNTSSKETITFNQNGSGLIHLAYGSKLGNGSVINLNQYKDGVITLGGTHDSNLVGGYHRNMNNSAMYQNGFVSDGTTYNINQTGSGTVNVKSDADFVADTVYVGKDATLNVDGNVTITGKASLTGTVNVGENASFTLAETCDMDVTTDLELSAGNSIKFMVDSATTEGSMQMKETGNLEFTGGTLELSLTEAALTEMAAEAHMEGKEFHVTLIGNLSDADVLELEGIINDKLVLADYLVELELPTTYALTAQENITIEAHDLIVEDNALKAVVIATNPNVIPEPATATLSLLALAALAARRRRR